MDQSGQCLDVTGDGNVTPIDALNVINYLNETGIGTLPAAPIGSHAFVDTNGNGACTPIDALQVINFLNAQARSQMVTGQLAGSGSNGPDLTGATGPTSNAPALSDVVFAVSLVSGPMASTGGPMFSGASLLRRAAWRCRMARRRLACRPPAQHQRAWQLPPLLVQLRRLADAGLDPRVDVEDLLDLIV